MITALFAKLWVKVALAAAVAALLITIYGVWHHKVFQAGVNHQLAIDAKALSHNQAVFTGFGIDMAKWSAPLEQQYIRVDVQGPERVKTVTRIVHDNPTFAAVVRPPELARMRAERHAEIRAAADASASAAAGR